jgi:omega-6 fatty acid desaturase (delta-12 desaturase)
LLNTVLPYLLLWGGTAWMLTAGFPYWTVLPALALAAGLLVRVFIIFHDCCHGSFFPSRVANAVTAYLTGLLAFTRTRPGSIRTTATTPPPETWTGEGWATSGP